MRIEEGLMGSLVVHSTPEEWQRLRLGLEDMYSELKHDVLPAGEIPNSGGVIVDLKEALCIMAIMEDEELTRSVIAFIFQAGQRDDQTEPSHTSH